MLNRNIIRIIFNLPNSKSLVELMKLIISRTGLLFLSNFLPKGGGAQLPLNSKKFSTIVRHSGDLAEISLPFRKEFLIKTAVLYRDQGKNKQAMECLLDTNKGPSILDDDCELKTLKNT